MSFKSIVNGQTDKQRTETGHKSLPCHLVTGELKNLSGIPSVANVLDPVQALHFVRPNLGPNCLQRLSADAKSSLSDLKRLGL